MMKNMEKKITAFAIWFIILQPALDLLTSVMARFVSPALTLGMVARMIFVGLTAVYLFFLYQDKYKRIFQIFFVVICGYGIASIAISATYNGMHTIVENAKMFFKMYFFLFALMFYLALYVKHGFLVPDWTMVAIFITYTGSIFLSAVTDTSFVTYEYAEGYCGWFYAGNEVGAVVSILAMVALTTALETKSIVLKTVVPALLSFAAVYIGTKVPYWAGIGALVLPMLLYGLNAVFCRDKKAGVKFAALLCALLFLLLLFQWNSPIKINNDTMMGWHYDQHVTQKLEESESTEAMQTQPVETEPATQPPVYADATEDTQVTEPGQVTEPDQETLPAPEAEPSRIYYLLNWILSNRLEIVKPAVNAFANGALLQRLFGMGYLFNTTDGQTYYELIEMDFVALVINHGIIGIAVYMAPILVFAFLCLRKFFQNIRHFFDMDKEIAYFYSLLIGFGCAFLAGHVLVAPSVSIYLAVIIVNLYARLNKTAIEISESIEKDR